jgi:hypothetical protein
METLNLCLDASQIIARQTSGKLCGAELELRIRYKNRSVPGGNLETERRQALNHYQVSELLLLNVKEVLRRYSSPMYYYHTKINPLQTAENINNCHIHLFLKTTKSNSY